MIHFLRFNLVGLLGVAVQLTTLALLNRAIPAHYLLTSTLAVELTLLHNFAWHLHYTWPPSSRCNPLPQLLRFHLSNGLISLLGNLLLMRLLVRSCHSPILFANAITIACCGLANFLLAHHWVFSVKRPRTNTRAIIASSVLILLFARTASAQSTSMPAAPTPQKDYGTDCAYANFFLGPAASLSSATHVTGTAGITFGMYSASPSRLNASPQFELGIAGPLPGHPLDGLVSANYMFATKVPHREIYPSLTAGYTRFFVTGNAINFGIGVDLGNRNDALVRLEVRDYFLISQPDQHIVALRVGFGKLIAD